ncbi:MAG: hypothetical protein Q9218_002522 [Villophora microphyllina]
MATSFDALLQADRQKRRNETRANELLGKGRRSSTPSNGVRKPGAGASLASRIGGTKFPQRSTSLTARPRAAPISPAIANAHHASKPASPRNARPVHDNPLIRKAQRERLQENLATMDWKSDANGQANVRDDGAGITIRGLAGPHTVVGSNFSPGTTAADIESAMHPVGGAMQDCRIVAKMPTVIAEMVFSEKAGADNVIARFNNKRADGRLLRLHLKAGSSSPRTNPSTPNETRTGAPHNAPSEPKAARVDLTREENAYDRQREQYDRNRRRAEPEFQDGSYGFEGKEDRMEVDKDDHRDSVRDRPRYGGRGGDSERPREERRLYSDDMNYRSRGRGYR